MPSGTITDLAAIFGSLGRAGDRPGDSRAGVRVKVNALRRNDYRFPDDEQFPW